MRREDRRLVTGRGRFSADIQTGAAVLAVVRSSHPHARLRAVELEMARAMPGVLAAWTAADMPVVSLTLPDPAVDGIDHQPRPVLAAGQTRYQGEPVAVIVADSEAHAADALAAVRVDVEELAGIGRAEAGELAGSVRLGFGDAASAIAGAPARVTRHLRLGRVSGAAIEPRAVTALPGPAGTLLLHTATQWVHGVRAAVAGCLGIGEGEIAVVAEDVGGAFGGKGFPYPEEILVAAAAHNLGIAVRWVATRSEEMLSSAQAHGGSCRLEAAADSDGRLLAVTGQFVHDCGAYTAAAFAQAENIAGHMLSIYSLPALDVTVEFRLTNRAPTRFIRGGGRPIGNFAIERLMDALADRLGLERGEIRRRNLLAGPGPRHESGLEIGGSAIVIEGDSFAQMLASVSKDGLAPACGVESSGMGRGESAAVLVRPDGDVEVRLATTPQGQSHETVFADLVASRLNWPAERVHVLTGDSRLLPHGFATAASRSAIEAGSASAGAAGKLRERLLELAAEKLEAAPEDLVVGPQGAAVRGLPSRSVGLPELIPAAGLSVTETFRPESARTWGANCHGARVDVDPETGSVRLIEYVIAHDPGLVLNAAVVAGQVQGGWVHGIGYALYEELAYGDDGALNGSTFLDYLLPGMTEIDLEPRLEHFESVSQHNPLGVRGVGEAGTIPCLAAIASAVELSLRAQNIEVTVEDLPITPERLLNLIHGRSTDE